MNRATLLMAVAEAERFLAAARQVEFEKFASTGWWYVSTHPEAATVKRASMDLTKALAKMRQSTDGCPS